MTQTRRDDKLKRVLGERLRELVDGHLDMDWEVLAIRLGYANSSTLRRVRDGDSFLSVEKLTRLASVINADGRRVSVDWLLTGRGSPLHDANSNSAARRASAPGASVRRVGKVA